MAEGEFGTCKLWGAPAWVLKDSGTPTFGEGWGPKPFQWSAAPNYPGLVATGETFGSGDDARMVVIGHQIDRLIGKPTSDIATDDDGVVTVWVGASGSEAASSYLITVRNWSGVTLGAGKRCWIVWVNGAWYAEPWEC